MSDFVFLPPPSMPLYHGAWMQMVWHVYPNLGRWLVRISPRYYEHAVVWMCGLNLAYQAYLLEPPRRMVILRDGRPVFEPMDPHHA
jgi:hypothetical protein